MLQNIKQLIRLFAPHCKDTQTMERLQRMIDDRGSWRASRTLFDDIRRKTIKAEKSGDSRASTQYMFEEVCAKTLYNLTYAPAPYDADVPYWIIPNALKLAQALEISAQNVMEIIAPE